MVKSRARKYCVVPLDIAPVTYYLSTMTSPCRKPWRPRWPFKEGAILLALCAAVAPAAASVPAPPGPSIDGQAGMVLILFKYEDLFDRPDGGSKSFTHIDLDRNGMLSPEELRLAFGSRWQAMFKRLDRNGDGHVTPDEVHSSQSSSSAQGKASNGIPPGRAGEGQGERQATTPGGGSSEKSRVSKQDVQSRGAGNKSSPGASRGNGANSGKAGEQRREGAGSRARD